MIKLIINCFKAVTFVVTYQFLLINWCYSSNFADDLSLNSGLETSASEQPSIFSGPTPVTTALPPAAPVTPKRTPVMLPPASLGKKSNISWVKVIPPAAPVIPPAAPVTTVTAVLSAVSAVNFELLDNTTNTISGRIADVRSVIHVSSVVSSPVSTNPTIAPTKGKEMTSSRRACTSGASFVKTNIDKNIKVSSENNYISGFAAGDDYARFGIWATPFYSQSIQKRCSISSGFRLNSYGGTFGFDTKANEDIVIGLAFSAINTDIKHKDFKSAHKTKLSSFLLSAYAKHQFTNNWFSQGIFSLGSSKVNNKEHRIISNTQLAMAEGNYTSMAFATEILAGYNHVANNKFVVTPMFGLRYDRINDSSYNESGSAGTPLMEVAKKVSHKLDVVGGVRLTAMPFVANGIEITPEVHAFVRHDIIDKVAKVDAKITGLNLPSEKAKLQKTFYNVGASVNAAAYGGMDYGVSAGASFANQYVGVQWSVKVSFNF